jgi:hypothetical protein
MPQVFLTFKSWPNELLAKYENKEFSLDIIQTHAKPNKPPRTAAHNTWSVVWYPKYTRDHATHAALTTQSTSSIRPIRIDTTDFCSRKRRSSPALIAAAQTCLQLAFMVCACERECSKHDGSKIHATNEPCFSCRSIDLMGVSFPRRANIKHLNLTRFLGFS